MLDYGDMEWLLQDVNEWAFGHKIKGAVRWPVAEVYFDEDRIYKEHEYGWVWFVRNWPDVSVRARGVETCLERAVEACEKELGLTQGGG